MPKKAASPKPEKPAEPENPRDALVAASKTMIAERGWRGFSIIAAARKAGISVADAYKVAPDGQALLDVLTEAADAAAAEALGAEALEDHWRDRLFDALMARYDRLMPDRDLWRVIHHDSRRDIATYPSGARRAVRSMERLLEAAQLGGEGPLSKLRAAALAALMAQNFRIWLKDKDDQAKTMADLDRRLRRLERLFERVRPAFGGDGDGAPTDDLDPADGTLH